MSILADEPLIALFQRLEIFQGLSGAKIHEIALRAEWAIFEPEQTIMCEGTEGHAAVLVVEGAAVRTRGPHPMQDIEEIEPGSLLGEMAMFVETEHTSTVVAQTQVRALRINRESMLEQLASDPHLADHFVRRIAARLRRLSSDLYQIHGTLAAAASG